MPFKLMTNWGKWRAGQEVTGGELKEYVSDYARTEGLEGDDRVKRMIENGKLTDARGVSDERITELINRGVLRGFGDDARILQLDKPIVMQPPFEDRLRVVQEFNNDLVDFPNLASG